MYDRLVDGLTKEPRLALLSLFLGFFGVAGIAEREFALGAALLAGSVVLAVLTYLSGDRP